MHSIHRSTALRPLSPPLPPATVMADVALPSMLVRLLPRISVRLITALGFVRSKSAGEQKKMIKNKKSVKFQFLSAR